MMKLLGVKRGESFQNPLLTLALKHDQKAFKKNKKKAASFILHP